MLKYGEDLIAELLIAQDEAYAWQEQHQVTDDEDEGVYEDPMEYWRKGALDHRGQP